MFNLGVLLEKQGRGVEAERWYRKAASQGNSAATHNLVMVLRWRGDLPEAEWWEQNRP